MGCVLAVCASGCSTTKAARDQANSGAALTVSLEKELAEFRRAQAAVASARVESIRLQRQRLATYSADSALDERILKASGKTDSAKLYTLLKELVEARAADDRGRQAELRAIDEQLAKIVAAIPDNAAPLEATRKSLLVLGKELSPKDRVALALAFASEIKGTIDENRKKIAEAEAAAPKASAQPPADK